MIYYYFFTIICRGSPVTRHGQATLKDEGRGQGQGKMINMPY